MHIAKYILIFLVVVNINCNFDTPTQNIDFKTASGKDLVINEVYHVSPEKYNAYSWIELFNPTDSTYKWYQERKINDTTIVREHLVIRFVAQRKYYKFMNPSYVTSIDTFIGYFSNCYYDFQIDLSRVPPMRFVRRYFSSDTLIRPGQFVVIVNDRGKFDKHFVPGPFDPIIYEPIAPTLSNQGTVQHVNLFPMVIPKNGEIFDTTDKKMYLTWLDLGRKDWLSMNLSSLMLLNPSDFEAARWDLANSSEIALIRFKETVGPNNKILSFDTVYVDVVRYGGYQPNPEYLPLNIQPNYSVGTIPEYYSLARYKAYYAVGSTTDVFYICNSPIPGWYNQIGKK